MKIRRFIGFLASRSLATVVFAGVCALSTAVALGQGGGGTGGGGTGGGGTGGGGNTGGIGGNTGGFGGTGATGNLGGTQTGTTTGTQAINTGGQTGGATLTGSGNNPIDLSQNAQLNIAPTAENFFPNVVRSEGFIGNTASAMAERGFVGGSSAAMPAPNSVDFVGGVNSSTGTGGSAQGLAGRGQTANRAAGGRQQNALGALGGMGGVGGVGNANGGEIQRRGVRARVASRINVQLPDSAQVYDRFVSKINRLPSNAKTTDGVQIRIDNKTATLTGESSSRSDVDALIRQLRLEPGVYRVVDQVQIKQ